MIKVFVLWILIFAVSAHAKLSSRIQHPFYAVHKSTEGLTNNLVVLNSGVAALEKRLEIIRNAKHNIEVEYFIYKADIAGKILTRELVKAANRGVEVRILVDKAIGIFSFDEYYAQELAKYGIKVRYYNAAMILRFSTIHFRNHRKLISVDDQYAITGGRNIGVEYFDLGSKLNFLDRDVYVEGPMAKVMRESFDEFFENDMTERPVFPKTPPARVRKVVSRRPRIIKKYVPNTSAIKRHQKSLARASDFLAQTEEELELRIKIKSLGTKILGKTLTHSCPEMTYSSDAPGGTFWRRVIDNYSGNYRFFRKVLFEKLITADKSIIISSPYMLHNKKTRNLFKKIRKKGVDITLYTNSLASTDAVLVAADLYKNVFNWRNLGIKTYVHAGEFISETDKLIDSTANTKWGTHSKTQIYESEDYNEIMIGTYNIDNRSSHYNAEMGIFCRGNNSLVQEVKKSVVSRMKNGYLIGQDKTATNKSGEFVSVFGANRENLKKMILLSIPSWLIKSFL